MNSTNQLQLVPRLATEPAQEPCTNAFKPYLIERGYVRNTQGAYLSHAAHFFRWTQRSGRDMHRIDETLVAQFLDDHLPHCTCGWPTRGDRRDARAALGHLLVALRTIGVAAPRTVTATPVDEELCRFDEYMERVRGLAPKTRGAALRIVRELLGQRLHDRPVVFSALEPEQVRCCFARLTERCHASVSMGAVVSALYGYFRFRAACGDAVHALIGVYYAHISGKMSSHQNIGASGIKSKADCAIDGFSDKNPNTMP